MPIILDGTKGETAPGLYATGTFSDSYSDGVVVDYSSPNGRITVGSADGILFRNGGISSPTTLMTLDASGNLKIGTTSAYANSAQKVVSTYGYTTDQPYGAFASNLYYDSVTPSWRYSSNGAGAVIQENAGAITFNNAASNSSGHAASASLSERMRIDSSGNVGIGTASPSTYGKLAVYGGKLGVYSNAEYAILDTSSSGSGYIQLNYTGTSYGFIGQGSALVAGGGAGDLMVRSQANLLLGTNGANERMRIDTSGNVLVNTTTNTRGDRFVVSNTSDQQLGINATDTSTGISSLEFLNGGTLRVQAYFYQSNSRFIIQNSSAGVYLGSGATSWTSNSDERLKTDLKPIEDAANKVSTLRAVTGRFNEDKEGISRSFLIAQDVLAVFPEAVDATEPEKLGVAYSDVIPLLVAAIKELKAEIDELKGAK